MGTNINLSSASCRTGVSAQSTELQPGEFVYRLGGPHEIRSICGVPCRQCGDPSSPMRMSQAGPPKLIDPIPLYVVRQASFEEWIANIRGNGGNPSAKAIAAERERAHSSFF